MNPSRISPTCCAAAVLIRSLPWTARATADPALVGHARRAGHQTGFFHPPQMLGQAVFLPAQQPAELERPQPAVRRREVGQDLAVGFQCCDRDKANKPVSSFDRPGPLVGVLARWGTALVVAFLKVDYDCLSGIRKTS